jgi:hypothetical protein
MRKAPVDPGPFFVSASYANELLASAAVMASRRRLLPRPDSPFTQGLSLILR